MISPASADHTTPRLDSEHWRAGSKGQLLPLFAAHATALADRDGVGMGATATAFESMGAKLDAAQAADAAVDAHRQAGQRSAALKSQKVASRLAAECEGARTPGLPEPVLRQALTRREAEIAALAVQGLSDRAIADRLVTSVRTAESHLRRVYAKLGIAGRQHLAAALPLEG